MFVTQGQIVLASKIALEMPSCDHKEADTQLSVHIVDALNKGQSIFLVCTVDTDVVVILVGKFSLHGTECCSRYLGSFWYGKFFSYGI